MIRIILRKTIVYLLSALSGSAGAIGGFILSIKLIEHWATHEIDIVGGNSHGVVVDFVVNSIAFITFSPFTFFLGVVLPFVGMFLGIWITTKVIEKFLPQKKSSS